MTSIARNPRGAQPGRAAGPRMIGPPDRLVLDGRRPLRLDDPERVLRVVSGHVDVFAVKAAGVARGARHHLFRIESGGLVLAFPAGADEDGGSLSILAVGGQGAEALVLDRDTALDDFTLVDGWIGALSAVAAKGTVDWEAREPVAGALLQLGDGEKLRAPARGLAWISVERGEVQVMATPWLCRAGDTLPLGAGMWIEAKGEAAIGVQAGEAMAPADLWRAIDRFHAFALARIAADVERAATLQSHRLAQRLVLAAGQAGHLFADLAAVIVPKRDMLARGGDVADPLYAACRMVGEALGATILRPTGSRPKRTTFSEVIEIARASGMRARMTLLRADWWRQNAGPLIAWRGEDRSPVALLPVARHRYVIVDAASGDRRRVDEAAAAELAPEAAMLYPALPSRPLAAGDLLRHAVRQARGDGARILVSGLALGALTLVVPLITEVLMNSVIPNTEIDQLEFCAAALALVAVGSASFQALQSLATLRLEGVVDRFLLAGLVDRLLRLPVSFFRRYTAGDLADRAQGIEAIRQTLSGRGVRGLFASFTVLFSLGLMFSYDARLAAIAAALAVLRGATIAAISVYRLRHERHNFDLQGKAQGLVLQFLTGLAKLRVAFGAVRALSVWARAFALQKRHFVASQRAQNLLTVLESAFPTLATLFIFAAVGHRAVGARGLDTGQFLAFYVAFGQSLAAMGELATAMGESLIAIPYFARIRPLIAEAVEVPESRKPPGELSGALEMGQVTFRYLAGGPIILNKVSFRLEKGEYVALVGPSGSGKSTIFRLLLGFEKPESGGIFFDGKALDTLDVAALRRQIGVVLQNGKLASGSIYENICGGVQLPLERAWEAARLAGLAADIEAMPMGMHTVVAEGVSTLSGGQRQRLMIARALVHRPRIVLFDEATSALDNRTQAVVSASLARLSVTRLVIAHRLSTVRSADRIIVLGDGAVVQAGRFEELSTAPGPFAEFARRQLL